MDSLDTHENWFFWPSTPEFTGSCYYKKPYSVHQGTYTLWFHKHADLYRKGGFAYISTENYRIHCIMKNEEHSYAIYDSDNRYYFSTNSKYVEIDYETFISLLQQDNIAYQAWLNNAHYRIKNDICSLYKRS